MRGRPTSRSAPPGAWSGRRSRRGAAPAATPARPAARSRAAPPAAASPAASTARSSSRSRAGPHPGDYVCSATVVHSNSAHPRLDRGALRLRRRVRRRLRDQLGLRPRLPTTARRRSAPGRRIALFTTAGWAEHGDIRQDLGAARLARDAEGRGIEDVLGARGRSVSTVARTQQYTAFGYPAPARPASSRRSTASASTRAPRRSPAATTRRATAPSRCRSTAT